MLCLSMATRKLCMQPQFAAQLVFYKLGEAAQRQQPAWYQNASDHAHWQVARGYRFESVTHQVLSNSGEFPFRLLDHCCQKALSKDGRLHCPGSKAASL
ncbi:TPA: hypothetical protein ACH3X1_007534 [Trebouxia sp. C0004]